MSDSQVIARKFRPQAFDQVVGQEAITRTLKNAISSQRLHHAYLFTGARGVGKTTTARILAKALNCVKGITADPCGECASCLEIAASSSLDVHEIDAASHTGIDNVRDVIISTLQISPARDRYKVFIIDEVHQLSTPAFNALLKTLEEPPQHVVFIMATTELHKVPETILSRCQVFEFRTISTRGIFDQLRRIAEELGIQVSDRALMSIARAGEGSMRDAESALDQVISFAGSNVADEDVSTALGLVDTETLANLAGAIARQDSGQVLRLADEVVARGYNLRNLCKELMVFFRGLLVTKVAGFDPELVQMPAEEADSFIRLADSFSEQDLIRFFSILAKTEQDIKESLQPRFHMEIGLMKLVHASRLYLLEDALAKLGEIQTSLPRGVTPSSPPSTGARSQPVRDPFLPSRGSLPARLPSSSSPAPRPRPAAANAGSRVSPPADMASKKASSVDPAPEPPPILEEPYQVEQEPRIAHSNTGGQREVESILNKLETQRKNMLLSVLDHAVSIRVDGNLLRVTFQPTDTTFRSRLEARDARKTLEETAREVLGREITLSVTAGSDTAPPAAASTQEATAAKDKAEEHPAVRSLLDAFHGEVIEVIKPE